MSAPGDWQARLRLDPTAFVAPGAVVVGDVTLGARAGVWFQCVLRGDTAPIRIGDDTNVQDLTMVHVDHGMPAVVGSRVTIGHRAIVHGCTIGDDCLVGMGAVVLSGAVIGAGSLIGAGALVKEGQQIPPGSLALGAPARVVGPVAEAHAAAIRDGSRHYAELARSYLRRGFARPHPAPGSDLGTAPAWRGPMTAVEWDTLVARMGAAPARVRALGAGVPPAAWDATPARGGWSAAMVLGHLRDVDERVYAPRVERLLAEDEPAIEAFDAASWTAAHPPAAGPAATLAAWEAGRASLVARLAPLGPEAWRRLGWHSARGPFPLGEMVREWAEHDASHVAQLARALGARA